MTVVDDAGQCGSRNLRWGRPLSRPVSPLPPFQALTQLTDLCEKEKAPHYVTGFPSSSAFPKVQACYRYDGFLLCLFCGMCLVYVNISVYNFTKCDCSQCIQFTVHRDGILIHIRACATHVLTVARVDIQSRFVQTSASAESKKVYILFLLFLYFIHRSASRKRYTISQERHNLKNSTQQRTRSNKINKWSKNFDERQHRSRTFHPRGG